ncbi:hypothetical protein OC846_005011 [Tilletia horrida]|uniref:Uncharacterized protein n=1 Tax=Tilletia horrida TaxID=155126 RepID=A0AAN6GM96_9BASI|nr:hypothetical protein OC846_005011 [Tilletia horrida]
MPSPAAPAGQGSAASTVIHAASSTPTAAASAPLKPAPYPGSSIVTLARAPISALPPMYQLLGFSAVFAGAGYIVQQGDSYNGSGVMSAWTAFYLFFRLVPSLRPKAAAQPLPFLLASSTLAVGSIYAARYFTQTPSTADVVSGSRYKPNKSSHSHPSSSPGSLTATEEAAVEAKKVLKRVDDASSLSNSATPAGLLSSPSRISLDSGLTTNLVSPTDSPLTLLLPNTSRFSALDLGRLLWSRAQAT